LTYEIFFDAFIGLPVGRAVATPNGVRRRRNKPRRATIWLARKRNSRTRLRAWSKALRSSSREAVAIGDDRR
jgi:hypothetical protein